MDMRFLMKQAQQMQQKLQDAQQNLRATGTAGGELVTVTLDGRHHLVDLKIQKDAIDPEDPSMLEDLLKAAFKDASTKAEEAMATVTRQMTGGLNIPGLGL